MRNELEEKEDSCSVIVALMNRQGQTADTMESFSKHCLSFESDTIIFSNKDVNSFLKSIRKFV